ncbi:MAG: 4-carboxy-4-hydroxy-2-oxoadipate aldolase/oxaloacetate decarboxylase [Candidatus Binatia bacterium]
MTEVRKDIERPEAALVKRAAVFSSATLHEAMGRKGALPYGIKPIHPDMRLCGPAVTVSSSPIDNLMIHRAIYVAQPGDILVVVVGGHYEAGYFGEIMTYAAQQRGIAGFVIDGCVRDAALIHQMGFPVFARGLSIRGTKKEGVGHINQRITIGEIVISPGDLIAGDGDGLVVVPREEVSRAVAEAQKREEKEEHFKQELAGGKTTLDLYGWRDKD